ncbi:Neuropeptide Y receptor [Orchesella cincta]|uniref:Neuropeptide Y receptor n=1 Tax=Orchesella cincta TaxID=48709 RepID=A0A1D2MCN4_ORCCI|nr:Neuropeptide Y receptor [Orchesella cincta]
MHVSPRMRTVTNMFIANLALADIIIGLFAIPFQFQAAILQRWNLPNFMCAFCPFVQVLSVNVSVSTLSSIAMDRYWAVMYPLEPRASKRKATYAILSIWFLGVFLALPTEFDYKVIYIPGKDGDNAKPFCTNLGLSPTFRMYYNLGLVVIQYFLPLIIISGAYAQMGRTLWATTVPGNREITRDTIVLKNKKKDKFQTEFRARFRFLRVVGVKWDESVFIVSLDIGEAETSRQSKRCFLPYLHESYNRRDSLPSAQKGVMKKKQFSCNNRLHHRNPQHLFNTNLGHQQPSDNSENTYCNIMALVETIPAIELSKNEKAGRTIQGKTFEVGE